MGGEGREYLSEEGERIMRNEDEGVEGEEVRNEHDSGMENFSSAKAGKQKVAEEEDEEAAGFKRRDCKEEGTTEMCVKRRADCVNDVIAGSDGCGPGCAKCVGATLWRDTCCSHPMTCEPSDEVHAGSAGVHFPCCGRSRSSNLEQTSSAERLNRGAKPAEVYGFVSSIVVVVDYVVFLVWAYTPEQWLHAIGVTYYPSRYWAIAISAYVPVAVIFAVSVYLSLCLIHTQPPNSVNTIYDDYSISKQQVAEKHKLAMEEVERDDDDEPSIPPMCDIPIVEVNDILFGTRSQFHNWRD